MVWAAPLAAKGVKAMTGAIMDLKVYIPKDDKNRNYRINEILPEVAPVLERARRHRGAIHITTKAIDKLIKLQADDPGRAVNWLRWRYLGELDYKEAFVNPAQIPVDDRLAAQDRKIDDLQKQLERIESLLMDLSTK